MGAVVGKMLMESHLHKWCGSIEGIRGGEEEGVVAAKLIDKVLVAQQIQNGNGGQAVGMLQECTADATERERTRC